ncbi:lymphocyte-specific protein 1 isoform X3 [Melanerpes formicivorus]|uniref:lymphocyte-specific protein 1 isoform X3 n=1 Tax=Melanerpes formicivorus TaxID=211600 RepID=UPI00358E70FF
MSDSEGCQEGAEAVTQVEDPGESERLTAQWSVEDEEEAARERRRRQREKQLRSQAEEGLNGSGSCTESLGPAEQNHYDFKPSGPSELEEDEGFSDWSQKLEQRKQSSRSPRQSYQEEDSGVREAEAKLKQIQMDQESPEETCEENVAAGEQERLCQEEQQAQEQDEEEEAKLKLTDRTESLNRSIKKSNSIKKSQPPLPVSKIDDKLEQYTQAIETSTKTPKAARLPCLELPGMSMMVSSTKSLWETGEVAAQSAAKSQPCKDIVAGDILSKRSLWEQKGSPKPEASVKSTPGKRYKFVATGHGQYKKVLIDDDAEQ